MAVIFDMDGVLVDSELHWKRVEGSFLEELLPQWTDDDQLKIIGMSIHDVHALLTRDWGLTLSHADFISHYESLALKLYGRETALLPGALELARALSESGVKLGICSSSPRSWIEIVWVRFELAQIFSFYVSADDVGGIGKPNPACYRLAVERAGTGAGSCVAIEDTDKGVAAARGAGIFTVGLRNGFNNSQHFTEANYVAAGFEDTLKKIILERFTK